MHSNNTWIDILSSHLSHVDVCRPSVVQTLDIKPVCVFVPVCVNPAVTPPHLERSLPPLCSNYWTVVGNH